MKHALIVVASLVLGFFGGFVLAVVTWPFWDWFERKTGIESMGHSGPADWVFYFLASLAAASVFAALEFALRKRAAPAER